jgi:hypothetical protein
MGNSAGSDIAGNGNRASTASQNPQIIAGWAKGDPRSYETAVGSTKESSHEGGAIGKTHSARTAPPRSRYGRTEGQDSAYT